MCNCQFSQNEPDSHRHSLFKFHGKMAPVLFSLLIFSHEVCNNYNFFFIWPLEGKKGLNQEKPFVGQSESMGEFNFWKMKRMGMFIYQDLCTNKSWLGPRKKTMIAQKWIRISLSHSDQTWTNLHIWRKHGFQKQRNYLMTKVLGCLLMIALALMTAKEVFVCGTADLCLVLLLWEYLVAVSDCIL